MQKFQKKGLKFSFHIFSYHALTQDLLDQSQRWKHQDNLWNLFKVDNKDIRKTSLAIFRCLSCYFEQTSHITQVVPLLTLNKQMLPGFFVRWTASVDIKAVFPNCWFRVICIVSFILVILGYFKKIFLEVFLETDNP